MLFDGIVIVPPKPKVLPVGANYMRFRFGGTYRCLAGRLVGGELPPVPLRIRPASLHPCLWEVNAMQYTLLENTFLI